MIMTQHEGTLRGSGRKALRSSGGPEQGGESSPHSHLCDGWSRDNQRRRKLSGY